MYLVAIKLQVNVMLDNLLPDEIIALTVYGEARGESLDGQIAVINVIKNRFKLNKYQSIKEVCLEPNQFSCWNLGDVNRDKLLKLTDSFDSDKYLKQILYLVRGVLNGKIMDNVKGNRFYFTNTLFNSPNRPKWSLKATNVVKIGNQTYFQV